MSRTATCQGCGQAFETPSDTGRMPSKCETCAPSYTARYRAEILELRAELDAFRAGDVGAAAAEQARAIIARETAAAVAERDAACALLEARKRKFVKGADRQAVARAVRRVGLATGREETRARLQDLADVADSWAAALAGSDLLEVA